MALTDELLSYINRDLLHGKGTPVAADEALIERGLLDSMTVMRIVTFVEERTGRRIPDEEVTPSNFGTVRAIGDMVNRLGAG